MFEKRQFNQGQGGSKRGLLVLGVILVVALLATQISFGQATAGQTKTQKPAPTAKKAAVVLDPCEGIPQPTPDPTTHALTVKLTLDPQDKPVATPSRVCVHVANNEEVKWEWGGSGSAPEFNIFFAERTAPFSGRHFSRGNPQSGRAVVAANPNRKYKYFVAVDGHGSADPDVIIQ